MRINDTFQFGKYKGQTPRELIRSNKGWYLVWCLENIKSFKLEPEAFGCEVRRRYTKHYLRVKEAISRKHV